MNNKLKEIIFDKLYDDLKHVEIIPYGVSIWFIDRNVKYWYLKYETSGRLWYRHPFFSNFFALFSLKEGKEFTPIISKWVEEVLDYKVKTIDMADDDAKGVVGKLLDYKVKTSHVMNKTFNPKVNDTLNHKVKKVLDSPFPALDMVETILDYKVKSTISGVREGIFLVGGNLNQKK